MTLSIKYGLLTDFLIGLSVVAETTHGFEPLSATDHVLPTPLLGSVSELRKGDKLVSFIELFISSKCDFQTPLYTS